MLPSRDDAAGRSWVTEDPIRARLPATGAHVNYHARDVILFLRDSGILFELGLRW